jgi:signal transduction histidine kinase
MTSNGKNPGPAADAEQVAAPPRSARWVPYLEFALVIPMLAWFIWALLRLDPLTVTWGGPLFFTSVVIAVDLIPVPIWGGMQLSLSFPILISLSIIYPPAVAGLVALVGSVDPREFRREVKLMRAMWNRCQMAATIAAASATFHLVAPQGLANWNLRFVLGAALAAVVAYAGNALLVAFHAALTSGISLRAVLKKMHGTRPYEFVLSYLGLGLFGAMIAKFYVHEGALAVIVFLAPLVFARQMYFRSRALADELAERNKLLAEQAERLELLLQKEHATVDELRELNRMKGEFVAVVSHEVRTPVTALIGYAKTLRNPEFSDDPALRREFLERMERQGDRLLSLIENLLTAAKLEGDELKVSVGRLRFEDLVRVVVEGLSGDAERVHVDLADELPELHTDRQLLGRVVSNLLDNALKYSPDGTPCELGARPDGPDHVMFWVRDHGIGIDPEQIDRIFDRFYQVDSSSTRRFSGAGLGLSMVRDLLGSLGGTITVESEQGDGSMFRVRLPIWAPFSSPADRASEEVPATVR